jgi:hypothetical protein
VFALLFGREWYVEPRRARKAVAEGHRR